MEVDNKSGATGNEGEETVWIVILRQWLSDPFNGFIVSLSLTWIRTFAALHSWQMARRVGSRPPLNVVLMLSFTLSVNGLLPALNAAYSNSCLASNGFLSDRRGRKNGIRETSPNLLLHSHLLFLLNVSVMDGII